MITIPEDIVLNVFGGAITALTTGFAMLARWVFGVVKELRGELSQCQEKHGAANSEASYLKGRVEEQSALIKSTFADLPQAIATAVVAAIDKGK